MSSWFLAGLLALAAPAVVAQPRPRVGKVTLRVTQTFPETNQALVFDKEAGKHLVVSEGERVGKYEVVEVGDDEVIVRVGSRELVLPAEEPAKAKPAPTPAAPGLLDPYAESPAAVVKPGGGAAGLLDPYASSSPVGSPQPVREVLAPPAQRAGATPVDPYAAAPVVSPTPVVAPIVTPAPVKPPTVAPAPPPAPPPATPAVETIRVETMTLKRAELSAALSDFDRLAKDVGFARTGTGVRLGTVAPGSYFHGMGLRSGDLVTAIDGAQLRTLDDAAGVYARLGSAKKLSLDIQRGGARGVLRFALK